MIFRYHRENLMEKFKERRMFIMFEFVQGFLDGVLKNLTPDNNGWLVSPFVFNRIESVKNYKSRLNKKLNTTKVNKLTTEAMMLINQNQQLVKKNPSTLKEQAHIEVANRDFVKRACEIFSLLKSKEISAEENYRIKCQRTEKQLGIYFSGVALRLDSVDPAGNSLLSNIAPDVLVNNPAIINTLHFISGYINTGDQETINNSDNVWKEDTYVDY